MIGKKTAVGMIALGALLSFVRADVETTMVTLAVASDFGKGMNWGEIFSGYQDRGTYRNLARMSDGRWIIADSRTYNFLIFDETGRFMRTLWKKGLRDSDAAQQPGRIEWISLLDDKSIFVLEPSRIRVFDLDGKEVRSTPISHPVQCFDALDERTVALAGSMDRPALPKRYVAGILDLETGKEIVVMDSVESTSRKKPIPLTEDGSKTMSVDYPFAEIRSFVRRTPEGGFIAGFSNWPEIEVYDKSGRQLRIISLKTERAYFEISTIESIGSQARRIENIGGHSYFSYKKRVPKSDYPKDSPYYYNLAVNDEGEILVFSFPSEGTRPVFQSYSPDGRLKLDVVLDPGDFELLLTPAAAGISFFRGDLYALAEPKAAAGIRLRFMKCFLKLGSQTDKK
jgi:hypothetical protein